MPRYPQDFFIFRSKIPFNHEDHEGHEEHKEIIVFKFSVSFVVKFSSFFVSLELVERLVGVSKVVRIFKSPINT